MMHPGTDDDDEESWRGGRKDCIGSMYKLCQQVVHKLRVPHSGYCLSIFKSIAITQSPFALSRFAGRHMYMPPLRIDFMIATLSLCCAKDCLPTLKDDTQSCAFVPSRKRCSSNSQIGFSLMSMAF